MQCISSLQNVCILYSAFLNMEIILVFLVPLFLGDLKQKHLNRKQAGSWFGVGMAANENN